MANNSGLDRQTLQEIGGAPSEVGVYNQLAANQPAPQPVPQPQPVPAIPAPTYPVPGTAGYAGAMLEANPQAYANSLTGQLDAINAPRYQQHLPPLTLEQFRQALLQGGTGPNMQGYDALRQLLMTQAQVPGKAAPPMAMNATPLHRPRG